MKVRNIIKACGVAVAVGAVITSCTKKTDKEVATENFIFNDQAQMQVYNGILNSNRNFIYVDAKPINGATHTYNTVFPGAVGPTSFTVGGGFRAFLIRDTLLTSTQVPMSFGEDLQSGRNYTLFTYDTITTPKNKLVANNIVVPTDTTARLRFANLIYNPSVLASGFDVFSVKRNAVIFSNVKESEVTDYIPYASALTDTFYIRLNGSSTNLQNLDTMGRTVMVNIAATLNPTKKRSYTLVFRGGYRAVFNRNSASPFSAITNARGLTTFANY